MGAKPIPAEEESTTNTLQQTNALCKLNSGALAAQDSLWQTLSPEQCLIARFLLAFLARYPQDKTLVKLVVVLLLHLGLMPKLFASQVDLSIGYCYEVGRDFQTQGSQAFYPQPHPGRPKSVTQAVEASILGTLWQAAVHKQSLPSDEELAQKVQISARRVRQVRGEHNLLRPTTPAADKTRPPASDLPVDLGYTRCGGLWLLLPFLLSAPWWQKRVLRALTFVKHHAVAPFQLVLTVLAATALGIKRLYHLNTWQDIGLALFTGRLAVLDQSTAHKLSLDLVARGVERFYALSAYRSLKERLLDGLLNRYSVDEHVVPRWTRLVELGKTLVPSLGRKMRAIKLFYVHDLGRDKVVALRVKPGNTRLSQVVASLARHIRDLHQRAGDLQIKVRLIFDAGGYRWRAFVQLTKMSSWLTYLGKAIAYPRQVGQWAAVPETCFQPYQEEPPRGRRITLTVTSISRRLQELFLTVLIKGPAKAGDKLPERYTAFLTNDQKSSPSGVADEYRLHWGQERCYRTMRHDLNLDALPKNYRFRRGEKGERVVEFQDYAVLFIAWLKALVYNLITDFKVGLGEPYAQMLLGSIQRRFLCQPARLLVTQTEFRVVFEPFADAPAVAKLLADINARRVKIPWLGGLVLQFQMADQPTITPEKRALLVSLLSATPF